MNQDTDLNAKVAASKDLWDTPRAQAYDWTRLVTMAFDQQFKQSVDKFSISSISEQKLGSTR